MAIKKVLIAGGGISGLTARYVLSQAYPNCAITLLEKGNTLGGCIQTAPSPLFFERGPRTFKASRSQPLLQLIDKLGLSKEIVYSNPKALRRFIWKKGKLRALTPFSSLVLPLFFPLLKEWRQSPLAHKDETIASFATRRFGKYAAETFFDPLTLGIFGGNMETLSMSACFPTLKAMETDYGSLTRAFLKKKPTHRSKRPLFTLKGGLQTLIDRLVEKGRGEIHLNTPLTSLEEGATVLALPASAIQSLFLKDPHIQTFFNQINHVSLTVVQVAFKTDLIKKKGFGYLVPTSEKDPIMGVMFDSAIFPLHNQNPSETRLTVMLKTGGIDTALKGLERHLGIREAPIYIAIKRWKDVLPQYGINHLERVTTFEKHMQTHYPHIHCIGNFLRGVSVSECIASACNIPLFSN